MRFSKSVQLPEKDAEPSMSLPEPSEEAMRPVISVVIPCYNAEEFIEETILSALNQTFPPREVIVIDDGSTDESATIAASINPKVRVISQKNQGESVARNLGFVEAAGDWIAFLDADDVWEPTKLEEQVKLIEEDVVCIHTAYYRFGTQRGIESRANVPPTTRYSLEYLAVNGFLNASSILIRKSVLARFPGWTQHAEDIIFYLEISREGRIRMVLEPVVGYRVHASNASSRDDQRILWHETIMTWLCKSGVDSSTQRHIERAWNDRLIVTAIILSLQGQGVQSRLLFKHLKCLRIGLGGWIAAPFRFFGRRWRYALYPSRTG